jgi:uncharacterized phage infection (PIP) family protein YhgE
MPKKIRTEEGEELEVYTQEEIDNARDNAIEEYKQENPGNAEEVKKLQEQLDTKTEELENAKAQFEDLDDKDKNFAKMREKVKKLEQENENLTKRIDETVGSIQNKFETNQLSNTISQLAGNDEELAKEIKEHYENTLKGVKVEKPEDFEKKVKHAYTLATGRRIEESQSQGSQPFNVGQTPGAINPMRIGNSANKKGGEGISDEAKDMARNRLGLTDEDIEKYDKPDKLVPTRKDGFDMKGSGFKKI